MRHLFSILISSLLLTTSNADLYNGQPALSPTGNMIAFVSTRAGSHDIWVMEATGNNPSNLTPDFKDSIELLPRWSPDDKYLSFESNKGGEFKIWTIDIENNLLVNLTQSVEFDTTGHVWSPDSNKVLFVISEGIGNGNLGLINQDGTEFIQLTHGDNDYYSPGWSPDGEFISFLSRDLTSTKLNLLPIGNFAEIQMIVENVITYAWSPTGDFIAFSNRRANTDLLAHDLWLLELKNRSLIKLTAEDTFFTISDLVWSPEGNQILFQSVCGEHTDIWQFQYDLQEFRNLTDCQNGHNAFPNWFQDGHSILFQSNRSGAVNIWTMNVDGSNAVNLVETYTSEILK